MKKYKVIGRSASIKEVEVERETEHSIWINGYRHAKFSEGVAFYDTYPEAREALVKIAEGRLRVIRREVESAEAFLKNVLDETGPVV